MQLAYDEVTLTKLMQNGFVESYNGRMRDELLNETLFRGLDQVRSVIANWAEVYSTAQPLSALRSSAGTAGVSSSVSVVTQASEQTSTGSSEMLNAASELARNGERFRQEVEAFLVAVRST